jgi:ribosome-associated translation inhibitor RaiA
MKILLHSNGVSLSKELREFISSRLIDDLSQMTRSINRVNFYFQDNNGPKGGCDKSCRLVIHLRRRPPVVIQEQDAELTPLIYRLLERAGQTLQRRITTRRERTNSVSMSGE